jgi:FMN-dependent NADH-azoreductase
MRKLLYVISSPRAEASESRAIADAFLSAYQAAEPDVDVDVLDLWQEPLPVFGGHGVAAKMSVFGGQEPEGAAAGAWTDVQRTFERFDAADDYLFAVPMWNHGVPWVLKHLIDTISQPGLVFGFDPEHGYTGLLRDKRAVAVYTGAVWRPGAPRSFGTDFHSTYFRDWLNWAGVEDVEEIRFQPTFGPTVDADRAAAHARARALGTAFARRRALAA